MQTVKQIRALFEAEGFHPRKRFGQNFLIDRNLMDRIIAAADLTGAETVLEIGPATGSLTEELLSRAAKVVASEIDRDLARIVTGRLGDDPKLTVLVGDVLAGKHELSPEVLAAVGPAAHLISNLPYNIATPVVALCLESAWGAVHGRDGACRFGRLVFTVQKEVADRLAADTGSKDYGPVSVLVALLGRVELGPVIPGSAFWPAPKVASRIVRIDVDAAAAESIADLPALNRLVHLAFGQRRKKVATVFRAAPDAEALLAAMSAAGLDGDSRPERIGPQAFAAMAAARGGSKT